MNTNLEQEELDSLAVDISIKADELSFYAPQTSLF